MGLVIMHDLARLSRLKLQHLATMNRLYAWLAKSQIPKLARHLVAYLGGMLATHGYMLDPSSASLVQFVTGLLMVGGAALWSVMHKIQGFDALDKLLSALLEPLMDRSKLLLWVEVLARKLVSALCGALAAHGVASHADMTLESVLITAANVALSAMTRPDGSK